MEITAATFLANKSVLPMTTTTTRSTSSSAPVAYQEVSRIFSAAGRGRIIISCGRRIRGGRGSAAVSVCSAGGGVGLPNSTNYVVPLDKASCITRPLAEILRDLNKRLPDTIIKSDDNSIPWYHANRMLSFYAPGWCGEIRDVIFSENQSVTVVYRVTIRGSDGEAHRESTGTVSLNGGQLEDPVAAAEESAFCRACARFGFGLYLYHEDEMP